MDFTKVTGENRHVVISDHDFLKAIDEQGYSPRFGNRLLSTIHRYGEVPVDAVLCSTVEPSEQLTYEITNRQGERERVVSVTNIVAQWSGSLKGSVLGSEDKNAVDAIHSQGR